MLHHSADGILTWQDGKFNKKNQKTHEFADSGLCVVPVTQGLVIGGVE